MLVRNCLRRLFAIGIAATAVATLNAQPFDLSNDFQGWLNSVQAPQELGTGTFAGNPINPTEPILVGLPGVLFQQLNGGGVSYNAPALTNTLVPNSYLEWSFDTAQNGWGGTFQIFGGSNSGLDFQAHVPGQGWINVGGGPGIFPAGSSYAGFFGFSSDNTFTGVRAIPVGAFTSYNMTDVSVVRTVPEPTTAIMAALSAALLIRRRRA